MEFSDHEKEQKRGHLPTRLCLVEQAPRLLSSLSKCLASLTSDLYYFDFFRQIGDDDNVMGAEAWDLNTCFPAAALVSLRRGSSKPGGLGGGQPTGSL